MCVANLYFQALAADVGPDYLVWSVPILLHKSLHDLRGRRDTGSGHILLRIPEPSLCTHMGTLLAIDG